MELRVTRARKIFADGRHNAFTGITSFAGRVFVAFRSATAHVSPDGRIRIIASADRESWELVADKGAEGADLRDPKLVAFKGALFAYCANCRPEKPRRSQCFRSSDGVDFDDGEFLEGVEEGRWLWFARPFGDVLYGSVYTGSRPEYGASFFASDDGLAWRKLADFPVAGGNEVPFDFDEQGVLYALVRTDHGGCVPSLCIAEPPYAEFKEVTRLPMRLQGPMIKRLEGGCVIVCRQWDLPGRRNLRTDIFWLGDGEDIQRIRALPSGGDTSYAGWLDVGDGAAVLSYYSSHEYKMDEPHANSRVFAEDEANAEHTTPADVFLANISYDRRRNLL